ncbi:bL21 family ribosomal protein [endosymbiont GvMRE of Glomus versiforme]|uniref:bL21 family ribosomal protein n=1 Tax=endosymbiont GvMRE of Glomus versiforme TaxID=2039283 RepID=UPI000EC7D1EC|nr:bL21 family ribosomal protein [endosymbiont GvMRE of Glomus versiforme]RHZ35565.1 50S ribosomal protein L21 [endosymbiont GvMRE of Glomus versiforme]
MSITFDFKGTQVTWFSEKEKGEEKQTIRIPLQKKIEVKSGKKIEVEPGDEIIIDKVLERDEDVEEFGQPYLPIKLIGKVIKNIKNKTIFGMKYKAKKRTKRTWGHRARFTLIKIIRVEEK